MPDESVLHRLTGSPQVMDDQLVHGADMARRPHIIVQVVPSADGANASLGDAFDIATAQHHEKSSKGHGTGSRQR